MKNSMRHRLAGRNRLVGRWLAPVLSVAATLALFASCSTEERVFESGNNDEQDAATDSGTGIDSGTATGNECDGRADGAGCGEMSGFVCINESCRESSCGDGFLDEDAGEECDDGNTDPDDGCEPETCTFSCLEDADCDDGSPCNGEETCDTANHVCEAGDAPDTTLQVPCTLPTPVVPGDAGGGGTDSGTTSSGDSGLLLGDSGVVSDGSVPEGGASDSGGAGDAGDPSIGFCKAGLCVPAGCGNGILQAGEECDDANQDNTDGCKADCTFTCKLDDDCNDNNVCNGTETCDTDDHVCVEGAALDCDDDNDCTENDCDPLLGCLNTLIDEDGDGHASEDIGACGDDCNDDDDTIYTGAAELCDGKDNDCDNDVDESAPLWFLDCDGDGYAQAGASSVQGCNPPDPQMGCSGQGWTSRIPINGDLSTQDCFDSNASVHPTRAPDPFSTTAVPSKATLPFDWNCDGIQEKEPVPTVSASASCGCVFEPLATMMIIGEDGEASAGVFGKATDEQGEQSSTTVSLEDAGVANPAQGFVICCGAAGFTGGQPSCGNSGTYTYCTNSGGSCARVPNGSRTQACR